MLWRSSKHCLQFIEVACGHVWHPITRVQPDLGVDGKSREATAGDSLGRKSQVTGIFNSKSRGATAGVSSTTGLGIRNNLPGAPVVALRLCLFWGHRTSDLHPRLSAVVTSQLSCSRVQSRSDDTQLPGTRVRAILCDNLLFEDVLHIEFDFVLSQDFQVLLLK